MRKWDKSCLTPDEPDEPEGVGNRCWGLLIGMKDGERLSLEQIRAFPEASEEVGLETSDRKEPI
jgi:hypothetical protein